MGLPRRVRLQEPLDVRLQRDELALDDMPDELLVDPDVIMDDPIPQTAHLAPGNIGMPALEFLGQVVRGFANDLQISHHRVDRPIVSQKSRAVEGAVGFCR